MLYRVDGEAAVEVTETTALDEKLYESQVEAWIASSPGILGEELLIIGRQVQLDDGADRIDLLAIDEQGRLVVIELKRDLIGGSADLQALRYAALLSSWTYETVRQQAEGYWRSTHQEVGSFTQEVESRFGSEYEIPGGQRVILVGRDVKPRLGTMALWLRSQGVDVRVVAISLLKDGDALYVQPQVVIPPPSEDRYRADVQVGSSEKPWLKDGQRWHLEQRCSPQGRQIVERLLHLIAEAVPDADGPHWGQKFYISWKAGNRIWAAIGTDSPNRARLDLTRSPVGQTVAAERLGYALFQEELELAEKFQLGSSVAPKGDGGLTFITKYPADVEADKGAALAALLRESWLAFSVGTGQAGGNAVG